MPGQSYELEDGSSSFKDFHGSRNNRFTSPEQAAKNRIQHPSNVLHFFNGQPDISVEVFNGVRQLERIWVWKLRIGLLVLLGGLNLTSLAYLVCVWEENAFLMNKPFIYPFRSVRNLV